MMRTDRSGNCANLFNFIDILVDLYVSSLQLHSKLVSSFIDAFFVPFTEAKEELRELRKELRPMSFYSSQ